MTSDTRRFELLLREELSGRNTGEGFGTLKEKRMHRVIRRYVLDDPDCWEIPLSTGAVADVLSGGTVYEIQTGSFYPLSGKIARITAETGLNITVVHPVIVKNRIIKIDPDGSVSEPKTSPVRESFFSLLAECVYIAGLFASGRLTVRALYVEAEDYRLRIPGKRRMKKIEVLPTKLVGEESFSSARDFAAKLPPLPSPFTSADFSAASRLRGRDISRALIALKLLGVCEETEKSGRRKCYIMRGN